MSYAIKAGEASVEVLRKLAEAQVDVHGAELVQIRTDKGFDGLQRVWINVNGVCIFRAHGIKTLEVERG